MSTSFALFGLPVNGLIAVGRARLISHASFEVGHYEISPEKVAHEQLRLTAAKQALMKEISQTLIQAELDQPPEIAAIIEVQRLILQDPQLVANAQTRIATECCNAEWAIVQSMERLVEQFTQMDNAYMAERQHDIMQLTERLLHFMRGNDASSSFAKDWHIDPVVVVAHNLSPAELINLKKTSNEGLYELAGVVNEVGGGNAHTSILARSLEIPAIVGAAHARRLIQEHEWVVLDGEVGVIIVNPDEFTLAEYHSKVAGINAKRQQLQRLVNFSTKTLDGQAVQLYANISTPEEAKQAIKYGADGIGLFRSEFLFLGKTSLPDEESQYQSYREVLITMANKPVSIRTLDIGGDKLLDVEEIREWAKMQEDLQRNSQLGLRAIRFSLAYPQIFRTQLRALLRASVHGHLRVLLPMVSTEDELADTLALWSECQAELRDEGIAFREHIEVGVMIEVPATIYLIPSLCKHIQFLALGTNDLVQYALAVDRGESAVSYLYNPLHPGVVRLIYEAIRLAKKHNLPLSLCGEIGGDTAWTRFLLGLGLRHFSSITAQVLSVKQTVLTSDCGVITDTMRRWKTANQAGLEKIIAQLNRH